MKNKLFYKILVASFAVSTPFLVSAQAGFQPLVGIPGINLTPATSFGDYVNALYILAISLAAIFAVIKIIYGGIKYMFTDIVTQKGDAKKEIQGALFGLLIVISATLILETINPQITGIMSFDPAESGVALTSDDLVEARDEAVADGLRPVGRQCERTSGTCGYDCTDQVNNCEGRGGTVYEVPGICDGPVIICGMPEAVASDSSTCNSEEECQGLIDECAERAGGGNFPNVSQVGNTVYCSVQEVSDDQVVFEVENTSQCPGAYDSATKNCLVDRVESDNLPAAETEKLDEYQAKCESTGGEFDDQPRGRGQLQVSCIYD